MLSSAGAAMKIKLSSGFTLLELLIGLSLSIAIVGAVGFVYISHHRFFETHRNLAQIKQSGEFVQYYLTKDLERIGYLGCHSDLQTHINNLVQQPLPSMIHLDRLQGYDGDASGSFTPNLPEFITGHPIQGSDVITVHTIEPPSSQLIEPMSSPSSDLKVNQGHITPGQYTIISNCRAVDLFLASTGTQGSIITHHENDNLTDALSTSYGIHSTVAPYHFYAYYLQNTGRKNNHQEPIVALVREDEHHQLIEIESNIERMNIFYQLDNDQTQGPNLSEVSAQSVHTNGLWPQVVGIHIHLLLVTPNSVLKTPQTYTYLNQSHTSSDLRFRQSWEIFIDLHNNEVSP
jgi:type IV pilus assembly protein PilW